MAKETIVVISQRRKLKLTILLALILKLVQPQTKNWAITKAVCQTQLKLKKNKPQAILVDQE